MRLLLDTNIFLEVILDQESAEEDVVRANILAAENEAEGVYNIGNGKNTTINQLADIILKLMKKDPGQSMTNRDLEIQGILWWIYLKLKISAMYQNVL